MFVHSQVLCGEKASAQSPTATAKCSVAAYASNPLELERWSSSLVCPFLVDCESTECHSVDPSSTHHASGCSALRNNGRGTAFVLKMGLASSLNLTRVTCIIR